MRKETSKILIIIVYLIITSCEKHNKETSITEKKQVKTSKNHSEENLFMDDVEKITLLSISKNIPLKQVNSVLKDYYDKTSLAFVYNNNSDYYEKVIDTISKKYNLSNQKTASIIFSYQYELITEEEIIENYLLEKDEYLSNQDNEY
ncbi:hypothetical protein [Flavobacterium solisilvae]|jgi:hypothetical protein|uniref:DUF4296 domain-containing protein n=1 Tax=Flavobacterium solisilvae TaxID=1852019 RepID=A0ABX1QSK1_9FLAO|nr:hypothetical protein [Flavobacterium solisilvae]NMH25250.1 hypothetical protein [Flavobacterium solisilvae]